MPPYVAPTLSADALGANFQGALVSELRKVSQFYNDKAAQLEVRGSEMLQVRGDGAGGGEGKTGGGAVVGLGETGMHGAGGGA